MLREEPYTQKEAEAATGLRTDNGPRSSQGVQEVEVQKCPVEMEEMVATG